MFEKGFLQDVRHNLWEILSDEGAIGYGNRIRAKYTAKWGVQIAGMIFQTGSNVLMLIHAAYFTDQALEDMVHNSLIVTSQYFKTMKEQP